LRVIGTFEPTANFAMITERFESIGSKQLN